MPFSLGASIMRQTYEVIGGPDVGQASLPLLRAALKAPGLDGALYSAR